ncbi:MAG: HEAT repeat domain-containing protein, partial [Coraliomargarita sp.]
MKNPLHFLFFFVSVSFVYGVDVATAVEALRSDDYATRLQSREDLLQAFSNASAPGQKDGRLRSLEASVAGHLDAGELPLESRLYLIRMLGLFGSDVAIHAIYPLLGDDEPAVRDSARRALAAIPGPRARVCLVNGLKRGP